MKRTIKQLIKKVGQEPMEIAKTAAGQVGGQGVKKEEQGSEGEAFKGSEGEAFKEISTRIQQLKARDKGYQGKAIPEIREKLGISAAGKPSQSKKPKKSSVKAPAIPSAYEVSLTAQVEKLRKEVKQREAVEKAKQAEEVETRKKKEETAKKEFLVPTSRRPSKVAPWSRKIKSSQGPGEKRPSFGKQ